jgi:RimJ/RimL family protein N-acetyltransferase
VGPDARPLWVRSGHTPTIGLGPLIRDKQIFHNLSLGEQMQSAATNFDTLTIRLAHLDDAERLWSWRNDPHTRRASHNTDEITLDQHTRWFERSLLRNNSITLIAELQDEAIGTVRFDKRRDSYLEVIMNIAPQARSKKLGAVCLREACNFVLKKKAAGFHAEIRLENTASIRIFQQCGFREFGSKGGFLLFRREPDQRSGTVPSSSSETGDV